GDQFTFIGQVLVVQIGPVLVKFGEALIDLIGTMKSGLLALRDGFKGFSVADFVKYFHAVSTLNIPAETAFFSKYRFGEAAGAYLLSEQENEMLKDKLLKAFADAV